MPGIGEVLHNIVSSIWPPSVEPEQEPVVENGPVSDIITEFDSPSASVWRRITESAYFLLGIEEHNDEVVQRALSQSQNVFEQFEQIQGRIDQSHDRWGRDLEELGITSRLPVHFEDNSRIAELISNRRDLSPDGRPLAVVIGPRQDGNGAFNNTHVSNLMNRGYRVVYYEASCETDLYNAIRETGERQQISLLMVGGHGVSGAISFGAIDPASDDPADESLILDISDEPELLALRQYLADDSVIVSESCSTGQDGQVGDNASNMLARVFSQSTVYSPAAPAPVPQLLFNDNNEVIDVNYQCAGEECTYEVPSYSIEPHLVPPQSAD
ncbi:MAG: hypothetical protein KJ732_02550 [Candidatus Margulisbacteria bacterium]|nr:hypothetical protein [Candidatus Margulisiibacteriota bacterium]